MRASVPAIAAVISAPAAVAAIDTTAAAADKDVMTADALIRNAGMKIRRNEIVLLISFGCFGIIDRKRAVISRFAKTTKGILR